MALAFQPTGYNSHRYPERGYAPHGYSDQGFSNNQSFSNRQGFANTNDTVLSAQIPARVYEHPAATRARVDAMYRRRRLGFAVVGLIFAYGLWSLVIGAANIASADSSAMLSQGSLADAVAAEAAHEIVPFEPAPTYVVRSGDTLFSIAAGLNVGGDLRIVVDQITALNNDTSALRPGQRLVLPAYASAD